MVRGSKQSKRKCIKRAKGEENAYVLSPFPSPRARPGPTSSSSSRHMTQLRNRMCRVNIKRKEFIEQPKRRDLRIKQAIDHSIRSHINRLSEYRHNSMLKGSDSSCPFGLCSHNNTEPVVKSRPKSTYGIRRNRSTLTRANKVVSEPVKAKKPHKKEKEQELRTVNFENYGQEIFRLDDIKHLTESVQHFEKQRLEFLSSLAKIHAQISSLQIPPASILKETAEKEMKAGLWKQKQEELRAREVAGHHSNTTKIAIASSGLTHSSRKPAKHKKSPQQIVRSPKLANLNSDIMDNLSKLLMNTAQRPTHKVDNKVSMSNLPLTVQNGLAMKGLSSLQGGGLMNLAQTFCSAMTTAF